MVVMRRASEADFLFTASEYDEELRVLRFNGTEAISEPFKYSLRLAALDSQIDFETIVGKTAYLTIYGETGERYVNGIITRFSQAGVGNRYTTYNAELMPTIALLSMRYKCRIFQEMSVQDIITEIFSGIDLQSDQYKFALNEDYPAREYCVQYRESELNFISRLMEEEGIFYFFEHDSEKHVMVIADAPSVHTAVESPKIVFNPASGMAPKQENIHQFRYAQQIRPNMATFRDFNYEDPFPEVNLVGLDPGTDYLSESFTNKELEFYDYPGGFMDRDRGDDIARKRLQSLRQNVKLGSGRSVCRRFIPGYKFTLEGYPRSDFNQEYLITRLVSSGSQPLGEDSTGDERPKYNNDFECIPASVTYRPMLITRKPVVEGVQTAFVVGPEGSDIHTDDLGRVKVEFHWDRDERMSHENENRSCWIRVSHGYAGDKHGIQFTPLVGDEVIVDFLEGDPDRPIITGRVYNFVNFPHLNTDDTIQNIILTPYHHRLLLDDKKKSITLNTGGSQTVKLTDGSSEDVDNIKLDTSGGHTMAMSDGGKNIRLVTTNGHKMEMNDSTTRVYLQTSGGHLIGMTDQDGYITIETTDGNRLVLNDSAKAIQMNTTGKHQLTLSDADKHAGIWTSSGHKVKLSDADNQIEIQTAGGHSIKLNDPEQSISITSAAGNKIGISDMSSEIYMMDSSAMFYVGIDGSGNRILLTASSGNIDIIAPTGTIKISGLNIEIEASANLKMTGTIVESKANSVNAIKGPSIQFSPS